MTDKELINNGCKIKVRHMRDSDAGLGTMFELRQAGLEPKPKGGVTAAVIDWPNGTRSYGLAICHPVYDSYNKKIGRAKAVGRAVQDALRLLELERNTDELRENA